MSYLEIAIAGGTLLLSLVVAAITGTWVLGRTDIKLENKFQVKFDNERRELDAKLEFTLRSFGETAAALRQKVTDVEIWSRDNLVSKTTFTQVVTDVRENLKRFEDKMDERLDRLEHKLDRRASSSGP